MGAGALALAMTACACVAGTTPVRTPEGEVPAGALAVGDRVLSIDLAEGREIVARVVQIRRAVRECLALRWDGGVLVCTPDHPVYDAERRVYRPAADFVTGDARSLVAWTDSGARAVRVTAVDVDAGVHEVIDITVDAEPHNFLAASVVVHNKSTEPYSEQETVDGPNFTLDAVDRRRDFLVRMCHQGRDFELPDTELTVEGAVDLIEPPSDDRSVLRVAIIDLVDGPDTPFVDAAAGRTFIFAPGLTGTPCTVGLRIRFERIDDVDDGVVDVTWHVVGGIYPPAEDIEAPDDFTVTIEA